MRRIFAPGSRSGDNKADTRGYPATRFARPRPAEAAEDLTSSRSTSSRGSCEAGASIHEDASARPAVRASISGAEKQTRLQEQRNSESASPASPRDAAPPPPAPDGAAGVEVGGKTKKGRQKGRGVGHEDDGGGSEKSTSRSSRTKSIKTPVSRLEKLQRQRAARARDSPPPQSTAQLALAAARPSSPRKKAANGKNGKGTTTEIKKGGKTGKAKSSKGMKGGSTGVDAAAVDLPTSRVDLIPLSAAPSASGGDSFSTSSSADDEDKVQEQEGRTREQILLEDYGEMDQSPDEITVKALKASSDKLRKGDLGWVDTGPASQSASSGGIRYCGCCSCCRPNGIRGVLILVFLLVVAAAVGVGTWIFIAEPDLDEIGIE